jgi:hypothetical protein
MLEMGFVIALGLLVSLAKLPWKYKLWITSHPVAVDLIVFVGMLTIHWGTFSGVMVASIAALFCSVTIAIARRLIGFTEGTRYVRGFFDVANKIGS